MLAIKELVKVNNHQIILNLPSSFDENEEVEVIVLSKRNHDNFDFSLWTEAELEQTSKIGLHSDSFGEDNF